MSRISGIYKITNKVNGKSYIGRSVNIKTRWSQHKSSARLGSMLPIHCAIRKNSADGFNWEILCEGHPGNLPSLELEQIKLHESYGRVFGYNVGGTVGGIPSKQEIFEMPIELQNKWASVHSDREAKIQAKRDSDKAYDAYIFGKRSSATKNRQEGYQKQAGEEFKNRFNSDEAYKNRVSSNRKLANIKSREARQENSWLDIVIARHMRTEGSKLQEIAHETGKSVAWASLITRRLAYASVY